MIVNKRYKGRYHPGYLYDTPGAPSKGRYHLSYLYDTPEAPSEYHILQTSLPNTNSACWHGQTDISLGLGSCYRTVVTTSSSPNVACLFKLKGRQEKEAEVSCVHCTVRSFTSVISNMYKYCINFNLIQQGRNGTFIRQTTDTCTSTTPPLHSLQ